MSHVIELPDNIYHTLKDYATKHGQTPESLVSAWVESIGEQAGDTQNTEQPASNENAADTSRDPWAGFYGITELLSPDSLDRHDYYLAQE